MRRVFFLCSFLLAIFANYALFAWMKWYTPSPRPFVFAMLAYHQRYPVRIELRIDGGKGFAPASESATKAPPVVAEARFAVELPEIRREDAAVPDKTFVEDEPPPFEFRRRTEPAIEPERESLESRGAASLSRRVSGVRPRSRYERDDPVEERGVPASLRTVSARPKPEKPEPSESALKGGSGGKRGRPSASGMANRFQAEPVRGVGSFYPQGGIGGGAAVRSVTVSARINAQGVCVEARVMESSGFPALDRIVLDAVRRAAYRPAVIGGVAVETEETFAVPVHRR